MSHASGFNGRQPTGRIGGPSFCKKFCKRFYSTMTLKIAMPYWITITNIILLFYLKEHRDIFIVIKTIRFISNMLL
jgi:hypothetical protein